MNPCGGFCWCCVHILLCVVQLLAIVVIIFGVWMSTHHDSCRKSLTVPVLGLGAVIFLMSAFHSLWFWCIFFFFWMFFCYFIVVFYHVSVLYRSIVGFLGALKNIPILLWVVSLSDQIHTYEDYGIRCLVPTNFYFSFNKNPKQ